MGSSTAVEDDSLKALRDGQARWQERRRRRSIDRVAAFEAWLKADSVLWGLYQDEAISRDEWLERKPSLPLGVPSDHDFVIAREAAAEAAVAQ